MQSTVQERRLGANEVHQSTGWWPAPPSGHDFGNRRRDPRARSPVLPAAAREPDRGREADERQHGQDDHRYDVRDVPGGEVRDEDRAGDRRSERRAKIGDAAREAGDLALALL